MTQQLAWYTTRSSGIVAWVLVTAAVLWGLVLSSRPRRPRPAWVLDLHRFVGGLSVAFVAVHIVALRFDTYVGFGYADVLVPMASHWRPGAVAWGIVALYLLVAVEISSLLMRRLPRRGWHAIHLASFVVFATSTAHALAAGADAQHPLLRASMFGAIGAVVTLCAVRVVAGMRARERRRHLRLRLEGHRHDPLPRRTLRPVDEAITEVVRGARGRCAVAPCEPHGGGVPRQAAR